MSLYAARIISADIVTSAKLVLYLFLIIFNLLMVRSADALETGKQHYRLYKTKAVNEYSSTQATR